MVLSKKYLLILNLFGVIKVMVIKVIKDSGERNIYSIILYYKKRERAESA